MEMTLGLSDSNDQTAEFIDLTVDQPEVLVRMSTPLWQSMGEPRQITVTING